MYLCSCLHAYSSSHRGRWVLGRPMSVLGRAQHCHTHHTTIANPCARIRTILRARLGSEGCSSSSQSRRWHNDCRTDMQPLGKGSFAADLPDPRHAHMHPMLYTGSSWVGRGAVSWEVELGRSWASLGRPRARGFACQPGWVEVQECSMPAWVGRGLEVRTKSAWVG